MMRFLTRQLDGGHLFAALVDKVVASLLLCLVVSPQIIGATIACSSNRDDSVYWCNRTEEYCCIDGCCVLVPPSDSGFRAVYNFWYFWAGLGLLFLLLIAVAVVCALKCYRHTQSTLQWSTNDINNDELYRTMQDARGLIRPFLASKEPVAPTFNIDGSALHQAGVATLHSYGLAGTTLGIEDGLSPLQPPYPPLRPPGASSLAARRNSDQIASIIMPPGFVQSNSAASSLHDHMLT